MTAALEVIGALVVPDWVKPGVHISLASFPEYEVSSATTAIETAKRSFELGGASTVRDIAIFGGIKIECIDLSRHLPIEISVPFSEGLVCLWISLESVDWHTP